MIPTESPSRDARLPRLSLRLKLTLWMVVISLVIQLTLGAIIVLYERSTINSFLDDRFMLRAHAVVGAVKSASPGLTDDDLRRIATGDRFYVTFHRFVLTVYDATGRVEASTVRPAREAASWAGAERNLSAGRPWFAWAELPELAETGGPVPVARTAVMPFKDASGDAHLLFFAADDAGFAATMRHVLIVPLLAIPAGLLASGIAAWLIAGIATAPFQQFREMTGSLAPESIDAQPARPSSTHEIAELQAGLEEIRAKLRDAFRAQDRFIAHVSHELKTPIAVVLTEAQTVREGELSERGRLFVRSVSEEMRRLGRMVESFLTLTRLRAGKTLTAAEPCLINDFVTESVQECGRMALQHGVRLRLDLEEEPLPLIVLGENELLRVMVDNLVRNAIRFSSKGQAIDIAVFRTTESSSICVRDEGPGIPTELLDTLFDRFTQAPAETARGRGHGLGLSIAQGIAELHGGRISVRNLPEAGAEFTVTLPLSPAAMVKGAAAD